MPAGITFEVLKEEFKTDELVRKLKVSVNLRLITKTHQHCVILDLHIIRILRPQLLPF